MLTRCLIVTRDLKKEKVFEEGREDWFSCGEGTAVPSGGAG